MELAQKARDFFDRLQDEICEGLQALEGKQARQFKEDRWRYDPGAGKPAAGGGVTRILTGARVFEKAGVNVADVTGVLTDTLAQRLQVRSQEFRATGVSLVVHPISPMVPTVHMNLRFIHLLGQPAEGESRRAWFGGGSDLTPYYLFEQDVLHFHETWREVCDRYESGAYARFKKNCDAYFYNTHRDEARGVGGIFFDYLQDDLDPVFEFVQDVGQAFLPAYAPIVERRKDLPWYDPEREWQLIRRGRYVEFNLVHDRGTLFGLETRGRTESILMSLPPLVRWVYDHHPAEGSREAELLEVLKSPRDWVGS